MGLGRGCIMAITFYRQKYNSLIFKLILGTLLVTVPLIFFLIFDNYYAIKTLHNKVSESNSNTISLYMSQIDSELHNIDNYILSISTFDTDVNNIDNSDNTIRNLSKLRLQNEIIKSMSSDKFVDGLFIYSKKYKDYFDYHSNTNDYSERRAISSYITKVSENGTSYNHMGWFSVPLGSSNYLFRIFSMGDVYVGGWIDINTLMPPLLKISMQAEGCLLFATSEGIPMINNDFIKKNKIDLTGDLSHYYISGKGRSYLVIGKKSELGKFSLILVTSEKNILQGLDIIQLMIGVLAILSILVLPMALIFLRKWIFKPITVLKQAINKVEKGDLDYRIADIKCSNEFMSVNRAFNNMTSQIKQLKIDIYEEQINKQKSELGYLQMQIRPHFFLNALNNIYSMAQMNDIKLIQDMVLYLSDYLRYLFKDNFTLVPLESELAHIRNYLQIQKIHSGEMLNCDIDADQNLIDMLVPTLILQTFIENIFKHALRQCETINVLIKITSTKNEAERYATIRIQDNGKGFSEEAMQQINSSDGRSKSGEHIGIWNVKQRLHLIYGNRASIRAFNSENSGACIEIQVPVEMGVKQL